MKKSKATYGRASARLMAGLPGISSELIVRGDKLQLKYADASLLRELGIILHRVQCGADARKLFRQDERTKPKKNGSALAFVYYYMRACSPNFSELPALEKIKSAKQLNAPRSAASIRKIAQQHRNKTLDWLERMGHAEAGEWMVRYTASASELALIERIGSLTAEEDREIKPLFDYWREWELTPDKVANLRQYLKKKSPHIRD